MKPNIFLSIFMCIAIVFMPAFAQDEGTDTSEIYSCRLKDFNVKLTYKIKSISSSILELEYSDEDIERFYYIACSEQIDRHELKCKRTGNSATILTNEINKGIIKITLSLRGKETNLMLDAMPRPMSLDVFIHDETGSDTNLRNAPNGKVVGRLSKSGTYMMDICDVTNGWWRICSNEISAYTDDMEGPIAAGNEGVAWIHYSVLGTGTRNYGGKELYLREYPSEKALSTYSFKKELILRPLEIKENWVKVETIDKKHRGWIEYFWLCGNALTTCP